MGRWEKNTAKWFEQTMTYCDLCGRIIPKNFWVVEEERASARLVFCNPDCEQLYDDYWLPSRDREQ